MYALSTVSRRIALPLFVAGSTLLGCGGGDTTEPRQRSPSTLEAAAPTTVSAPVATAVRVAVLVRDAAGAPMPGVEVSFLVTLGGGSVTPSSTMTDAAGAAAGSWTLGTVAGPNESRATLGSLPPVSFAADARAGPPSVMTKVSGDNQEGEPGAALAQPLSVSVKDSYDNPVSGAAVTFAVTSGGGTMQFSPATTHEDGIASAGTWTLGLTSTDQTATASIGTATAVFTAVVRPPAGSGSCSPGTSMAIGVTVAGALADGDCVVSGTLADQYKLTTAAPLAITISLTSTAFAPRLTVAGDGGEPVASGEHMGAGGVVYCFFDTPPIAGCQTPSTSTRDSPITLLAAPRSRVVTATSTNGLGTGAYALAATQVSSAVSGCRTVFMERGVTTEQRIEASDCGVLWDGEVLNYSDDMKIYLTAGSQLQVAMTSSAFTPWLDFFSPTGQYLGSCIAEGTAECTFPAPSAGYYLLAPSSLEEKTAGAYTLTVK